MRRGLVIGTVIFGLSGEPASAQWLKQPTAGLPRTADGHPDLQAPSPRTPDGKPDLSGIWGWRPGRYAGNIFRDLTPDGIQPWARALAAQRTEDLGKDDPSNILCLPQGPRMNLFAPLLAKIVQTPTLIVILSEDMTYRQIFLDGRSLPANPHPSFMGYSVGRWEEDTLVVDSVGFKDRTWLDFGGHPHSEALRITERITRTRLGHLQINQTLEDTAVYARPWTVTLEAQLVADTELLEYVCHENEKSRAHMVGKASDDAKHAVVVAPEILSKYVGTYEYHLPENPTTPMFFTIRMEGGALFVGSRPLIPLSDTSFGGVGRIEIVRNAQGDVLHVLMIAAEGEMKAVPVPAARPSGRQ